METCSFLAALCVGIGSYSNLTDLPKAKKDAELFARKLRCRGLKKNGLFLCVGVVTEFKLGEAINSFLKVIRGSRAPHKTSQLVVIYLAGHGQQMQAGELPSILTSEATSTICEAGCVHLDSMLLRPLDSMRECKLKVWLVIDTCRENRGITTWTNNEEKEPKRSRWHSPTDFQILLACDRGRLARDQPSLADALIHAMQDSSKDTWHKQLIVQS